MTGANPARPLARKPAVARLRSVAAGVALAAAGAVAACGSSASSPASAPGAGGGAPGAVSMATSIATAADSWAVLPMSAGPAFWQVLARAGNSGTWKLVTPPGVADNGGLVASAGGASSLTVAVRPSQDLVFSPLAETANGGASWSTGGPVDAAVAASPDALAAAGGKLAALLSDGAVETSSDAGATWSTIAQAGRHRRLPRRPGDAAARSESPRSRSGCSPSVRSRPKCWRAAPAGPAAPPRCSPTRPARAGSG